MAQDFANDSEKRIDAILEKMTLEEIRDILKLMEAHELSEFQLERDGVKLKMRKPWMQTTGGV